MARRVSVVVEEESDLLKAYDGKNIYVVGT